MSSRTDQVPLLVPAMSSVESTTRSETPTTPTPQSIQSSSLSPPIDKKLTIRPKIRGSMANLLRRKCLVRSLHSIESVVRPKVFLMDDNDDDEDTALLTDSSSRTTSSSYDLYYTENDRLLR